MELTLAATVDADQPVLESLRLVIEGLTRFDTRLSRFECGSEFGTLPLGKHRDLFHRGDGDHCGAAAHRFCLICHQCNVAYRDDP